MESVGWPNRRQRRGPEQGREVKREKQKRKLGKGNKMRTDKERLDYLQKITTGYGRGWILRPSTTGRGWRLHESSREGALPDIRDAIDFMMDIEEEVKE